MRTIMALMVVACSASSVFAAEKWREPYTGKDAIGDHVLGYWTFDESSPMVDASGNEQELTLRGRTKAVVDGKFGGGLECFNADPDLEKNKAQGVMTNKRHPRLSPKGAFTAELWFKLKPDDAAETKSGYLIDNKYYNYKKDLDKANTGFCLFIERAGEAWRPRAMIGYGDSSDYFDAQPQVLDDQWHHIAFSYDGRGAGKWMLDGKMIGRITVKGRKGMTESIYQLSIGARIGSTHIGFPGYIDNVRICEGARNFYDR